MEPRLGDTRKVQLSGDLGATGTGYNGSRPGLGSYTLNPLFI